MAAFLDIAFAYDPASRRCDLQLGADGDLLLDDTPATPMLISFGSDRRARDDDELPSGISELNAPSTIVERRGWAGDALDIDYRPIGSRLWLLERAKDSSIARLMCTEWLKEAFAWAEDETGKSAEIEVTRPHPGRLLQRIRVDGRELRKSRDITGVS